MVRWHLGIPVLRQQQAGQACPLCSKALDIFGDHAVTCNSNGLWKRHYLVQDFLLRLGRAAGMHIQREQSLLTHERREADLLINNWDGTTALSLDLTIRHPRAPGSSFTDPDGCLLQAEEEKRRGASARADRVGALFEPLVFHTWAGLSRKGTSRAFLTTYLRRVAENRTGDPSLRVEEMVQGLSCIVMAQVAVQILNTRPHLELPVYPNLTIPSMVDDFVNELRGVRATSLELQQEWAKKRRSEVLASSNPVLSREIPPDSKVQLATICPISDPLCLPPPALIPFLAAVERPQGSGPTDGPLLNTTLLSPHPAVQAPPLAPGNPDNSSTSITMDGLLLSVVEQTPTIAATTSVDPFLLHLLQDALTNAN